MIDPRVRWLPGILLRLGASAAVQDRMKLSSVVRANLSYAQEMANLSEIALGIA